MLSGSAPAGLSFLSKAARHSSGFTKSSEDETNPVASLCESCHETPHLTTIPPPTRPLSLSLSFAIEILVEWGARGLAARRAGSRFAVWAFKHLGIGFNLKPWHKKERINLKKLGPQGHLVERALEMTKRKRAREWETKKQSKIIIGKTAMFQGTKRKNKST